MEIELKKVDNGWIITITGYLVEMKNYATVPVVHFEPTLKQAFAFIEKTTGEK